MKLTLIWLVLSTSWMGHAAIVNDSLSNEGLKTIEVLESYQVIERTAAAGDQVRQAQADFFDHFRFLYSQDPFLLVDDNLAKRWFALPQAMAPENREILDRYIAITRLLVPVELSLYIRLENVDLSARLKQAFDLETQEDVRQFTQRRLSGWFNESSNALESGNESQRRETLEVLYRNQSTDVFKRNFANLILEPLSDDAKLRVAEGMASRPHPLVNQALGPYFVSSIDIEVWKEKNPRLLRQILLMSSQSKSAGIKMIEMLTSRPDIAYSDFVLVEPWGKLSRTTRKLNPQASEYTLIDQLFIRHKTYRDLILKYFVSEQVGARSLSLVDLYFNEGLERSYSLSGLLSGRFAAQDYRWYQWVENIAKDHDLFRTTAKSLVNLPIFYAEEGEPSLRIQSLVFDTVLQLAREGDGKHLIQFIQAGSRNTAIVDAFIQSWGEQVLNLNRQSILETFARHIFTDSSVPQPKKMQWLELFLQRDSISYETLARLAEGTGVESAKPFRNFESEGLTRTEAEMIRFDLVDLLVTGKTPRTRNCRSLFSEL